MNALDERLEGPAKRSRPQAVLRLQGFGPVEYAGGEVDVPNPHTRRFQRKPRALFSRPQCINRLIPLGDVGAGTERADHVSFVIAEKPVAPLDEAFLAGPGDDGILDDRQISAEQLSTLLLELSPHPDRKARLDPVAAKQFIRGPSQKRARVPIDEHDPPFQIQLEQDDVGGVQESLCAVALAAQGLFRPLALGDVARNRIDEVDLSVAASMGQHGHRDWDLVAVPVQKCAVALP